jgi:Receptor family ligand binding region
MGALRLSVTGQTTTTDPNTLLVAGIIDTTTFTWIPDIFDFTIQLINQGTWRDDILNGFGPSDGDLKLTYAIRNSACNETTAVRAYWDLRDDAPYGVIGARCSGATIALARIASLEGMPMLSPSSNAATLSSGEFASFSRMVAPNNKFGEVGALTALLNSFKWKQVTTLATNDPLYVNSQPEPARKLTQLDGRLLLQRHGNGEGVSKVVVRDIQWLRH